MVTITYIGTMQEVSDAAVKANQLLNMPEFYDAISSHSSFDLATISPAAIAGLIQSTTLNMTVEMYYSRNRRVFGYDDYAHPEIIHINSNRNEFNVPALAATMIHEMIHAVDNLNHSASFGHGDNSSRGKGNTAPYWIGNKAEEIISGAAVHSLMIHEGSPEAFV